AMRRGLKTALECLAIMPFDTPGAQRDRVREARAALDIAPIELMHRVDVTRLARAEVGSGGDEIRALASCNCPNNLQILPCLRAAGHFGARDARGLARIIVLGGEIADRVARAG